MRSATICSVVNTCTWLVLKFAICAGVRAKAWLVLSAVTWLSVSRELRTGSAMPNIATTWAPDRATICAVLSAKTCAEVSACIFAVEMATRRPVSMACSCGRVSAVTFATLNPATWLSVSALS